MQMGIRERGIKLSPRLAAAAEMLSASSIVADIGSDHGRLACALCQRNRLVHVIAADISGESLNKCARLAEHVGVLSRIELRVGDGLNVLLGGEADAVAILGMGAKLIRSILSDAPLPLAGAKLAVLSPMRGTAELRRYLYEQGYHVADDRIVSDAKRLYQVLAVAPPDGEGLDVLPDDWPEGCFELGYRAYTRGDPLFAALARQLLSDHEKRLLTAGDSAGARKLQKQAEDIRAILRLTEGRKT